MIIIVQFVIMKETSNRLSLFLVIIKVIVWYLKKYHTCFVNCVKFQL